MPQRISLTEMESVVRYYATEQGMSFRAAMEFLSTRRTLTVAAQLLGLDKPSCLGEYLDRHGYSVPQSALHRGRQEKADGSRTKRRKKGRGDELMSAANITRETYLARRRAGETRNAIATSLGLRNSSYLRTAIKQWGLPASSAEESAMLQVMGAKEEEPSVTDGTHTTDEEITSTDSDRSSACLVLHIPYPESWKFQICAEGTAPVDQTADAALSALIAALVEVTAATKALTGREDVSEFVQGFFTRRLDRLLTVPEPF